MRLNRPCGSQNRQENRPVLTPLSPHAPASHTNPSLAIESRQFFSTPGPKAI